MYKKIILLLILVFFWREGLTQCAMCKAVAESSMDGEKSIVFGLNTGILYLMALPYFLLLLFGVVWFFGKKGQTAPN